MLNAHSPVHYKAFSFILSPHLLSTTSAHPCYKYNVAQKKEAAMKVLLVLGVCNPQSIACDVWSLHSQDKS
jgi:hypothetical protein